jgi:hypothetical protein
MPRASIEPGIGGVRLPVLAIATRKPSTLIIERRTNVGTNTLPRSLQRCSAPTTALSSRTSPDSSPARLHLFFVDPRGSLRVHRLCCPLHAGVQHADQPAPLRPPSPRAQRAGLDWTAREPHPGAGRGPRRSCHGRLRQHPLPADSHQGRRGHLRALLRALHGARKVGDQVGVPAGDGHDQPAAGRPGVRGQLQVGAWLGELPALDPCGPCCARRPRRLPLGPRPTACALPPPPPKHTHVPLQDRPVCVHPHHRPRLLRPGVGRV